jgi:ADP-heptose:LPS heptosyltransferase
MLCSWIDDVLPDEGESAIALSRKFHSCNFDVMLTLFSSGRVALAGWMARIPYRLAPATKLAQFFYNRRLVQRRSRSEKPEYAYNLDLALRLLADYAGTEYRPTSNEQGDFLPAEIQRPLLRFDDDIVKLKRELCHELELDSGARLIFIHPGSGGSANNLRPEQYIELANSLAAENCAFVITAGPGEEKIAQQVVAGITAPAAVYAPAAGLTQFARALQVADLFISGSTGPLHIAAALNRPTAAFYPRHRSATPLRWQTLNSPQRRLAIVPPEGVAASQVDSIEVTAAAQQISQFFQTD